MTDPDAPALPGIACRDGFRFRAGQRAFLEKLAERLPADPTDERNYLGVFVPGYGKTITAIASFLVARSLGVASRLVVFVPRGNLRDQYADAEDLAQTLRWLGAPPLSFAVADSDRVFLKNRNTEIVVTTYQYASGAGGRAALAQFCRAAPCLFVYDEVHHLADDGTWAGAIKSLDVAASVALSGTPIRSDNKTLFGVPHTEGPDGEVYYEALHEVGLADAHAEGGILKRVEVHTLDYALKMVREDTGETVEMTLSEMEALAPDAREVDVFLARQKLRFHEVYLESLLAPAFEHFRASRGRLARALARQGRVAGPLRLPQMLVIAMSNRHAAAILAFVRQRFPGVSATRIGQDLPGRTRDERLQAYREGRVDVMVQVDMIGEGTDIKPIATIVKADLVRAVGKTMQQVFRGMRYLADWPEAHNLCAIYASDDAGLVDTLRWIASEQQAGARRRTERPEREPAAQAERSDGHSVWSLEHVSGASRASHRLELQRGGTTALSLQPAAPQVIDVKARERALRQTCAELANELAHTVGVEIRAVHAAAKQGARVYGGASKGQADLSLRELEGKKRWLEKSLRARRLV